MKKVLLLFLLFFFSYRVCADSFLSPANTSSIPTQAPVGAVQFDSLNNTWPSSISPIKNLNCIVSLTTVGKYSFALGTVNSGICMPYGGYSSSDLITVNDGKEWSEPQRIQNMGPIVDPFIPMFPHTEESPIGWISGMDPSLSWPMLSFFDGKTFSPAVYVPVSSPYYRVLASQHKIWAIDLESNRVFWSADTQWNAAASLPNGQVITVVTDNLTDDIYALERNYNTNQYFLTHLLPNNQWDTPLYINFYYTLASPLKDLIVINGGKSISVLNVNDTGSTIFLSQNGGITFQNIGTIPPNPQKIVVNHFNYIYNGNKGNIFWTFASSKDAPSGSYDTLAYMDPTASNPAWTFVPFPDGESIVFTPPFGLPLPWKITSEDGMQLWIYGRDAKTGVFKTYYYDLSLKPAKFIPAPLNNAAEHIDFIQAANHGKAFGYGKDLQGNYLALFFDGNVWKSVKVEGLINLPYPSVRFRNNAQLSGPLDYQYKFIVNESSSNTWLFTSGDSTLPKNHRLAIY